MNPAFVIPLADECQSQLEACLGFLRSAYPDAPATVLSDGVSAPWHEATCDRHEVAYKLGRYLKRIECGGEWWRRLLEVGTGMGRPWLVKLDPDARVWRKFEGEPTHDIAGTIEGDGTEYVNVQGGCQAIRREAAVKILASSRLADPILSQHRPFAPDGRIYREWIARAYFSTDKSLLWLARNLGISWGPWGEVGSVWKPPAPPNHGLEHAVTHPHKLEPDPKFREAGLRVIVTCKGRLAHLKQTLPRFLAGRDVAATVVDYGCPQGTADWVRADHPAVEVVRVKGVPKFNLAHARNLGAANSPPGWWCFFDADCLVEDRWDWAIRESLRHRRYLLSSPIEWGQFGSVVVHSSDYMAAGGYDENFRAWGSEDSDFYLRLRHVGIRPGSFPGSYFSSIKHSEAERTAFYDVKKVEPSRLFYDSYISKKRQYMISTGLLPTPELNRRFLSETCQEKGLASDNPYYPPNPPEVDVVVEVDIPGFPPGEADVEIEPGVLTEVPVQIPGGPRIDIPVYIPARESAGHPASTLAPPGEASRVPGRGLARSSSPRPGLTTRPSASGIFATGPAAGPTRPVVPPGSPIPPAASRTSRTMGTISLLNHCTHDVGVPDEELAEVATAYLAAMDEHWPGKAARVVATGVILPNTRAIILCDDAAHAASLGYRDLTPDGQPLGLVPLAASLASGGSVARAVCHEAGGMMADPYINLHATDAAGVVHAIEPCDVSRADVFRLLGHVVGNFATPAWFEADRAPGSARFDYLGLVRAPFEVRPGGRASVREAGGWQSVHGDVASQRTAGPEPLGRLARREKLASTQGTHAHPAYLAKRWG